ncbi:acyltransferase [Pantoea agglomerans]|uniref:Acyltransferase n=1 Tax=Enterobacter agglomerans TaxID=549 RepID=A0ACC5RSQ2_ENTAG|nr:acyltransferase [Pantoea agglomerans]MBK4727333.1 acyltransferase [Pantoea agglomerans]
MNVIKKGLSIIFTLVAQASLGSYKNGLKVNFYSRFTKKTHVGINANFNGINIRGGGRVVIGDNFHSGKDILIINSFHQYDGGDAIPYDSKNKIDKDIFIEDNVWVGDRVIILGGVVIGEGAIIQAGSVVTSNVESCSIVGGSPAKHFKYRDIENYNVLKLNGKFI